MGDIPDDSHDPTIRFPKPQTPTISVWLHRWNHVTNGGH
jgi:hypothetical protein